MVTGRETQRRHSFHSLAHTAEKWDRKQPSFTSFFWQHLNMRVQSPGRQDMCLWIHPEHTHCSSTSRCQSFQKEIQNLCISSPRSENEEETVRKGKPTNVGSYIRQSILLRRVLSSFSSSHGIYSLSSCPNCSVSLQGVHWAWDSKQRCYINCAHLFITDGPHDLLARICSIVQSLSRVQLFHDPMDCSPPGSSVHEISLARILEWVTISFSRGSSWPRDWTQISCTSGQILYHLSRQESPELAL